MDEEFFLNNFNTPLPAELERQFQAWLRAESKKKKRDLSMDLYTYDMRGFWMLKMAGIAKEDPKTDHYPDTFKKPNHPTFSVESIYNQAPSPAGGKFQGGIWGKEGEFFMPSREMLATTHKRDYLEDFFKRYEKGIELRWPGAQ